MGQGKDYSPFDFLLSNLFTHSGTISKCTLRKAKLMKICKNSSNFLYKTVQAYSIVSVFENIHSYNIELIDNSHRLPLNSVDV